MGGVAVEIHISLTSALPPVATTPIPTRQGLGGHQRRSGRRRVHSWLYRDSNPDLTVVQTVATRSRLLITGTLADFVWNDGVKPQKSIRRFRIFRRWSWTDTGLSVVTQMSLLFGPHCVCLSQKYSDQWPVTSDIVLHAVGLCQFYSLDTMHCMMYFKDVFLTSVTTVSLLGLQIHIGSQVRRIECTTIRAEGG
jgi:hypothetical protein